jgi:carboxypeptidase family protein
MISSASRLGLGGFVADGSHRPIPGAEVYITGTGKRTTTDSTGAFFLGVKSGHYAVAVSKEGYGKQLLGVTIPADSGREIAVWLAAPPLNANRYADELEQMRSRSLRLPASRYAIRTSEDLARSGRDLLQEILAVSGAGKLCPNAIHGVGQDYNVAGNMPHKSEVAMLEVITDWPGRPGHRTGPPCAKAVVWMKP